MSGGVKNLRAMFESGNDSTSPPDRGRSPAQSFGPGSNGSSPQPRPLSKVRTSFVTVEKSGQLGNQLGLRRDKSGEPSMAMRRPSFSIDEEENPKATADRKQGIAVEIDARTNSAVAEIIPEIAIETEDADKAPDQSARKERGREPTRPQLEEKKSLPSNKEAAKPQNGVPKPKAAAVKVPEKEKTTRTAARPAPISTTKSNTAVKVSPKTTKSPLPKTPTTPKSQTAQKIEKRPEKQPSRASLAPKQSLNPSSKPTTSAAPAAQHSALKTRIGASPPQTGFVKPKPRSPTRPVKLPASLTAHTASSGSKTATAAAPQIPASRQSLSRASGHSQPTKPLQASQAVSRSPSRASTTTSKSTLTRKPSTLNKTSTSRPSLGPPPAQIKKKPSKQSLPAPTDEGFLARMMRSTASSASKTNDRVPTTPPKKSQPAQRSPPKHEPLKTQLPRREKPEIVTGAASRVKVTAKDPIAPKPVTEASVKGSLKKSRGEDVSKAKVDAAPTVGEVDTKKQIATTVLPALLDDGAPDSVASPVNNIADASSSTGEVASEPELANVAETTTLKIQDAAQAETIKHDEEEPEENSEAKDLKPAESEVAEHFVAGKSLELEAPAHTEVVRPEEDNNKAIPTTELSEAPSKEDAVVFDPTLANEDKQKDEEIEVVDVPEETKSELPVEDPEDARAREEIARLNAELIKGSEAKSSEVAM